MPAHQSSFSSSNNPKNYCVFSSFIMNDFSTSSCTTSCYNNEKVNDHDDDDCDYDDDDSDVANDNDGDMDSADEALCAMLGIKKSVIKSGGIAEENEKEQNNDHDCHDDDTTGEKTGAAALHKNSSYYYYSETTRPTLHHLLSMTDSALQNLVFHHHASTTTSDDDHHHDHVVDLRKIYQQDSVVYFPNSLCVQAAFMRRITEEVVWRSNGANDVTSRKSNEVSSSIVDYYPSDKTYETIRVIQKKQQRASCSSPIEEDKKQQYNAQQGSKQHEQHRHDNNKEHKHEDCCNDDDDVVFTYQERKCLTRLENFCRHHMDWNQLCIYIGRVLSIICDTEMILYKEKLNLKPPGGSGFAPHLDTPSLLVAATARQLTHSDDDITTETSDGPTSFVTVMVAIDDMTDKNGCLRVVKGPWTAENAVETIIPPSDQQNSNPDANGRAGAIPQHVADSLVFESLPCKGGTIIAFGGHVPHRSAANTSAFGRRAVFLTYNPRSQGDYHEIYYQRMNNLRNQFRKNIGLPTNDEQMEMQALSTIPRN